MVEAMDDGAAAAGGRLRRQQGVDDRLLRRLDDCVEQRVDPLVWEHLYVQRLRCSVVELVAGRECDDQVAARVLPGSAGAADAERRSCGESLTLVRQERR